LENTFKVGETVKVKRTSGKWEEGVIYKIYPLAGSKFIRNEKFGTHLKKLAEVQ